MNSSDHKTLLALWDLDNMPMCDKGMELARSFLEACGDAVANLGERANSSQFMSRWRIVSDHANSCPNCLEL
jgi:hypothetical protein